MKYLNITGILLFMLILSACVRDGEDPCPVGTVKLNLFVEKFQNVSEDPLDDKEENFYNTVKHVQYYLYKDGEFLQKLTTVPTGNGDSYGLEIPDLFYGDYEIAIVANSTKNALKGNETESRSLSLNFQGSEATEDYFTAVFPFTVDSEEYKEYPVGLLRTQGLVRYIFVNMPDFIDKFGISIDSVSNEKVIMGDYKGEVVATKSFTVSTPITKDDPQPAWTFPTVKSKKSRTYIELYQKGNHTDPYYTTSYENKDSVISVRRNHLVDVVATYNDGEIDIEIKLDTKWDGSVPVEPGIVD